MEVNYYFRHRHLKNNSFENLFQNIIEHLPAGFTTKILTAQKPLDWRMLWRIRSEKADVHHITGAVNYLAMSLPPEKTVLTIHDVGFYENATHSAFKRMVYGELWFRRPLRHTRFVTVVSEFTRQRLLEYFKVEDERIRVIPNPVLSHFSELPVRLPGERLNVLQIGSGPHKNLATLIKAARDLPVHLIKVGVLSEEEQRGLMRGQVSFEVHTGISNDQVAELYRRSDILYFASLYEGFGMPIIEAQTVGKPVITSKLGAMQEVANGSAWLVSPNDADEIRAAIQILHQQPDQYLTLVEKGRQNAKRFSLPDVVGRYAQLYREVHA